MVRNHASTLALSRTTKNAELVSAEIPDAAFDLLRTGAADAFASIRPSLMTYLSKLPGSRVLDDRYGSNVLSMVVPKNHAGWLSYVSEFAEEAKVSGLVQRAIDQAGFLVGLLHVPHRHWDFADPLFRHAGAKRKIPSQARDRKSTRLNSSH